MKKGIRLLAACLACLMVLLLLPLPEVRAAAAPGGVLLTDAQPGAGNTRYLEWQAAAGAEGYEISAASAADAAGEDFEVIAEVGADHLEFAHEGVPQNEARYYRVRAFAGAGVERAYGAYSELWESPPLRSVGDAELISVYVPEDLTKRTVLWNRVPGADGYELVRAESPEGEYSLVSTIESGDITAFVSSKQPVGSVKYYKIRAFQDIDGIRCYGKYCEPMGHAAKYVDLDQVSGLRVSVPEGDYTKREVLWNRVPGASGYELVRAESPEGEYSLVSTIKSGDITAFVSSKQPVGSVKYYKIRAFQDVDGVRYYGEYSTSMGHDAKNVSGLRVSVPAGDYTKREVLWNRVPGASGYELVRAESPEGEYSLVSTIKSGDIAAFVSSKQPVGSVKYYKIRAFQDVAGQRIYGNYSEPVPNAPGISLGTPVLTCVRVADADPTKREVFWSAVPGADGYELVRAESPQGEYSLVTQTASTVFVSSKQPEGSVKSYKVRAYKDVPGGRFYGEYSHAVQNASQPTVEAPQLLQVSVAPGEPTKRVIIWSRVADADGYELYRAENPDGQYSLVSRITDPAITAFVSSKQPVGSVKYYKILAYRQAGERIYYSPDSQILANPPLETAAIESVIVPAEDATKRIVSWKKVEGAQGYEIYRANEPDGAYELVSNVRNGDITVFVSSKQPAGSQKYYKIRAYLQAGTNDQMGAPAPIRYGEFSQLVRNEALGKMQLRSVEVADDVTKRIISWDALSGADGYELYRAPTPNGAFELVKDVQNSGITVFVSSKQPVGSVKYYKIRGYKLVNGAKAYGPYSDLMGHEAVYINHTHYHQGDAAWGFSREVEKKACVLTATAMLLQNNGNGVTPRSLYDGAGGTTSLQYPSVLPKFEAQAVCAVAASSPYFSDFRDGKTYIKNSAANGEAAVREALAAHPEGVMLYFSGSGSHAVVAIRCQDGTIYYSDPGRVAERGHNVTLSNTWVQVGHGMNYAHLSYMLAID